MNYEKQSKDIIKNILDKLNGLGIKNNGIEKGAYNFSSSLARDGEKLKLLVYFGKKGSKIVLQGNDDTSLFRAVNKEAYGEELFDRGELNEMPEPEEYVGSDESGKGDIFGPLVVAAVRLTPKTRDSLKGLDIKDSKLLSDDRIAYLAEEIKNKLKKDFFINCLEPKEYNQTYAQYGNLNLLLAKLHSEAVKNLINETETPIILIDKFADEKLVLKHFDGMPGTRKIIQIPRAEKYMAVAAASILARNEFANWFNRNIVNGLILPKGASLAAQAIFRDLKLKNANMSLYAKTHFKFDLNRI